MRQLQEHDQLRIVDGGSTDGTTDYLTTLLDPRVSVTVGQDAGPADGLRKGLCGLDSDILGFVNADDYLLPGALNQIRAAFEAYSAVTVIGGHGIVLDQRRFVVRSGIASRFTVRRFAAGATCLIQPSTYFRRCAYEASPGINPDNITCWDGELWRDLACAGESFKIVNRYWSVFRLHSNSISGSGRLNEAYWTEINSLRSALPPLNQFDQIFIMALEKLERVVRFALTLPGRRRAIRLALRLATQ